MKNSYAVVALLLACTTSLPAQESVQMAMGFKVGEVRQESAIVWVRTTAKAERLWDGIRMIGRAGKRTVEYDKSIDPDKLHGAVPGKAAQVRVSWTTKQDGTESKQSEWVTTKAASDFAHQFTIKSLKPATRYYLKIEAKTTSGKALIQQQGSFTTPAVKDQWQDVQFSVVTGQAYRDLDHRDGYHIYPAMAKLGLHFIVPTGDTVYYDSEKPRARTLALARHHWHRMYSMPRVVAFHKHVPGYWEKDDHDTYNNDGWPGQAVPWMKPFTWEQGLVTFREQVPMGEKTYRTVRWGKGLQVWMVEGRDFRSPNRAPDGPNKTIWGKEQWEWLKRTVAESDATFKVIVSPTPIVGPDRSKKNDNHANQGFQNEGKRVRAWAAAQKNLFICCGDRHWQYMSIDPVTKLREFSCGPASDEHAGGSPKRNPQIQPFHRVKGGFLSVEVHRPQTQPTITFRFHGVHGKVAYEWQKQATE